jgi:hypothetical protein
MFGKFITVKKVINQNLENSNRSLKHVCIFTTSYPDGICKTPSVLTENPQSLLNDFHSGKGTIISDNAAHKSVVFKFNRPIGNVVNPSTGAIITKGTFYGAIKYGRNVHITPVNWRN